MWTWAPQPPTMQTKHPGEARISSIIWAYVGPMLSHVEERRLRQGHGQGGAPWAPGRNLRAAAPAAADPGTGVAVLMSIMKGSLSATLPKRWLVTNPAMSKNIVSPAVLASFCKSPVL